ARSEMLAHQAHSFGNVSQVSRAIVAQARYVNLIADGPLNHRTFSRRKMKRQTHDFERKQEIGKNDGCIYAEGLGGGDGYISGNFRALTNLYQRILFAHSAILRHVTPGLA